MIRSEATALLEMAPPGVKPFVKIVNTGSSRYSQHGSGNKVPSRHVGRLLSVDSDRAQIRVKGHGKPIEIELECLTNWKSKNEHHGIVITETTQEDVMIRPRVTDEAVMQGLPAGAHSPDVVEPPQFTVPSFESIEATGTKFVIRHQTTNTFWNGEGWQDDPEKAKTFAQERFAKITRTSIVNRDSKITYQELEILTMEQAIEKYLYPAGAAAAPAQQVVVSRVITTENEVDTARGQLLEAERQYLAAKEAMRKALIKAKDRALQAAQDAERELASVM
jgi:hypothetical protein